MNPPARIFRNVLSQLCQSRGVSFRNILDDFRVEEVLEAADQKKLGAKELAAAILWRCCCTDGKFNNATIVFLAVMQFLKEQLKDIGAQPFMDLGKLLKGGTTEIAVTKWVETHYSH